MTRLHLARAPDFRAFFRLPMSDPMPDPMPDSPLAAQFEAFLSPILDRAFGFALRLTGNRDDAQDLVQDAALRAFSAFDSFEVTSNFKAWFFRILVNAHLNRARAQGRRPQTVAFETEEEGEAILFNAAQNSGLARRGDDPVEALLAKIDAQAIGAAIMKLPDEFRVVAMLSLQEMLSYEEIARMLEIPVGTVRSRLHRARKMLQKELRELAFSAE